MVPSQKENLPRQRAPSGVDTARRLRVALLPAERAELERRAEEDGRSISAMARIFMVRGMRGCGECEHGADTRAEHAEHRTGLDRRIEDRRRGKKGANTSTSNNPDCEG